MRYTRNDGRRILPRLLLLGGLLLAGLLGLSPAQAAYVTVTTVSDADNGADGECSLREAIKAINAGADYHECTNSPVINPYGNSDQISFNIPGAGVHVIAPTTSLPDILQGVTIDGTTQPGSSVNTLNNLLGNNAIINIELDGSLIASPANGIGLWANAGAASGVFVKGLAIVNFNLYGVGAGQNAELDLRGCFVGLHADGVTVGANLIGVYIGSGSAVSNGGAGYIGNVAPFVATLGFRNVIAGNTQMQVEGIRPRSLSVYGNLIGADRHGTKVAAGSGIYVADAFSIVDIRNNSVGGASFGISLSGVGNVASYVVGNGIGVGPGGSNIGNTQVGLLIESSVNNQARDTFVADNAIAFNGEEGIRIASYNYPAQNYPAGIRLDSNNAIWSNGRLGINLDGGTENAAGVTSNDAGDGDSGPNGLQNYPVITGANMVGASTTVNFNLNSLPNTGYRIQGYASDSCDPSGYGQGQYPSTASVDVTTNGSGNASGVLTVGGTSGWAVGHYVSLLAYRLSSQETSEFSACFAITGSATNGVCGIANGSSWNTVPAAADLCSSGTASAVTTGSTTYSWTCNGAGGGTSATCSAQRRFMVTASSTGHGTLSSSVSVLYGVTPIFTLVPDPGYVVGSVGGTCGGTLVGNDYTVTPVSANCTVIASFAAAPSIAPVITSGIPPDGVAGVAYAFTVTATGTAPITFSATGLAALGLSLNATTGLISGSNPVAGTAAVTLTASNGVSPNATQTFSLTIADPAAAPPVTTAAVPALSPWGILVLGLLVLFGLGLDRSRRLNRWA